jgi:DNA-binding transcriptional ArsR family regulator
MRRPAHPKAEEIQLTDLLYALSDPIRLSIVRCLAERRRPLTCGEITLDRPKSSMSHHFKILRQAGVIETRVEGKEHLNTLRVAELDKRFPGLMRSLLRVMASELPDRS